MTGDTENLYRFGEFCLDASERLLLKNGRPIHLQPKAFDTLLVLVANRGSLVTKDQLIENVWADAFVEENNLTKNISILRKVLNSAEGRFIETVPRIGYRFTVGEGDLNGTASVVEKLTMSRVVVKETVQEETSVSWLSSVFGKLAVGLIAIAFLIGALSIAFTMRDRASASAMAASTTRAQARDLAERGRALWQTRNARDLHDATVLLERSVALDPGSALAHAALADAYAFDFVNWKKAETEANKAIRLDPSLGEPHASIGFIRMFWEWRFAEAEVEFKRAIELSPNYATGHQWYAMSFAVYARKGSALSEMDQALTLEPASLAINSDRCQILYLMGHYDEALAQCEKTLSMDPGFLNVHANLYEIYTAMGSYDRAVDEFFVTERLRSGKENKAETNEEKKLRQAYTDRGITGFWRALAETYSQPPQNYYAARYYARLGERDAAKNWLRRSFENHDPDLILVAADPLFDDYHIGGNELDFLNEFLSGQK